MKTSELNAYYLPAVANILQQPMDRVYKYIENSYNEEQTLCEFDEKLGEPLFQTWRSGRSWDDKPLTDSMRKLLVKLAGPNGHFWLAYYRVQKGLGT